MFSPPRHALLVMVLLLLLLLGCTSPQWTKPGITEQTWAEDRYACERDARQSGYFGGGVIGAINMQSFFERCLEAKGYRRVQPVTLTPSEQGQIREQNKIDFMEQARTACLRGPTEQFQQCLHDYQKMYDRQHAP